MSDDLLALPLKSLQLSTKTVAKLKPLSLVTVGDLYKVEPQKLAALGLVLRELEEIAEAAADFGTTWAKKEDLPALCGEAPKMKADPVSRVLKPTASKRSWSPPADLVEAFTVPQGRPLELSAADFDFFAPYVDATGRHFKTPPVSPRHLRLVRRMKLVAADSIGAGQKWYLVAVVDVSQVPVGRAAQLSTFGQHMGNLVADLVERSGAKPRAQSSVGSAVQLAIAAKDAPSARALVEAHARWVGDGALYLGPIPAAYEAVAALGVAALSA